MAAELFKRSGGARERQSPPRTIVVEQLPEDGGPNNIAHVFDKDGTHLGDIAYRPREKHIWGGHGLFICG